MPELHSVALDASGTLWNDLRGSETYPLYGAFVELGRELGIITPHVAFPQSSDGTIDWSQKGKCVAAYKNAMSTLSPDSLSNILNAFSDQQAETPNIRPTGRQVMHMLRGLGDRAITAIISETQDSLVGAYAQGLATHFGVTFDAVYGSTYHRNEAGTRYTGHATRLNKGRALTSFIHERGLGRLSIAFADDPRADAALFTAAATGIIVVSKKTSIEPAPNLYAIQEHSTDCTITHNGTSQRLSYDDLPQFFTELIDSTSSSEYH